MDFLIEDKIIVQISVEEISTMTDKVIDAKGRMVCPGFIDTPLLTKGGISDHPEIKQHIIDLHPMKRMGKSEEIASGFIFLACDDSSFITGTKLEIDGGYLAE